MGSNAIANATNSVAIGGNTASGAGNAAFVNAGSANGVAIGNQSRINAASSNSTAVGFNNSVTGANSGAFGTGQVVNGTGSYAFGDPNTINGSNSFVVGNGNTINSANVAGNGNNIQVVGSGNTIASTASAANAVVFGINSTVNATSAVAIGNTVSVTAASGIGIGQNSVAATTNAIALGANANAGNGAVGNTGVTALGAGAQAGATGSGQSNATAVGNSATANAASASAFGQGATAAGEGTTALGNQAGALSASTGSFNTWVGTQAGTLSSGSNNSAFGFGAGSLVSGSSNTAIGYSSGIFVTGGANVASGAGAGSNVQGSFNAAMGINAGTGVTGESNAGIGNSAGQTVIGDLNAAIGIAAGANVTGSSNAALGDHAGQYVTGSQNVAIGLNAGSGTLATPLAVSDTVAIGSNAVASTSGGIAIGSGTQAGAAGSVALGQGSLANIANTISVGSLGFERKIVNVAAGTLSSASTDAVNGSQLFDLSSQIGAGAIGLVQQVSNTSPITVGVATGGTVVDFTGTAGNRTLIGINRIGIGTTTPGKDFQITNSDTPTIRLDQNNLGGFTAQTWDIGANEANFFVRDTTNGSTLPFRIRPGAPTSSIDIAASGNVGFGTTSPQARIDVMQNNTGTALHFGTATYVGGNLVSRADSEATMSGGAGFTGSVWTARNATASQFSATNGTLVFNTDSGLTPGNTFTPTTRMIIDSAGNVGIGTTTPAAQLSTTGSVRFAGLSSCGNGLVSNNLGDLSCGPASLVQQSAAGQPITVGVATDGTVVDFTGTAGTRRLTGVSAGVLSATSTDAVNGSQLFATNSNVANLQGQIAGGSVGLVQQDAATRAINVGGTTDGTSVNFAGTAGTRTLTGVSAGALTLASTDAVNGSQLLTANQRVANAFGTTLDGTGQINAPSYTIQGTAYNNVGSAFTAVNTQLTANNTSITNLQTQIGNGSIGLVQQNATTRAITVGAATDGNSVNVAGTAGNRTVTGVAAGVVSAASTDAINGSQLFATNQQVASNTGAISTLTGQVATNTSDIASLNTTVAGLSQSGNYVRVNGSGPAANASGANAIAVGSNAQATQSGSIAIGMNSASTGTNAIAIGTGATATGSVAVGAAASASNGGAAFGDGTTATATLSTAVGPNASATAANSVSVGSGSTNTVANTASFGSAGNERRLTNVAAGINQTDAVNMGQLQSTAAGFQTQIGGLQSQIFANRNEARDGVAMAMAAGGSPGLLPGRKFALSANVGTFEGGSAFAAGATALLMNTKQYAIVANGSVGFGFNTPTVGGRGGVSLQW